MSEARALTNLIGNGVATVVVSKWENELDADKMQRVLDGEVFESAADEDMLLGEPELEPALD